MTENERNEILNVADFIEGEINRMCVTHDLAELDSMHLHASKHIDKLHKMIYDARFKDGRREYEYSKRCN